MYKVIRRGKYDIVYARSVIGDMYRIAVEWDEGGTAVEIYDLGNKNYQLIITIARKHSDHIRVDIIKLYGGKYKKNFEILKEYIDDLFTRKKQ